MNNDQAIEKMVVEQKATAPRVAAAHIEDMMSKVSYITIVPPGSTSTFVHSYFEKRFHLATGHSGCVSPENFRAEIGRKVAMDKCIELTRDKLWELEGWALFRSMNP
jgi:hypothetical protein